MTISVFVTPRVSFCAMAAPASATAPISTPIPSSFFINALLSWLPAFGRSGLSNSRVHPVDDLFVFRVHVRPLQLHGRRQLFVLGGENLLDQAELLDGLHPGELPVHPLDLAPDEVLHLPGPAERGEVGERHVALLREL